VALTGTWVDPYSNVSLSILGKSPSALSIDVNYGPLPCNRVNPTLTLSPPNPSAQSGTNVVYTLSLTNNDTAGCTSSTFNLASTLPAGFVTAFGAAALTVSPGQTLSTTMTKSVPAGFTPGTYAINAAATDTNHSASAGANVTVTAPPEPITVSLVASPTTVAVRSNVTLTATVAKSSGPVSGASVTFTVIRPGGGTSTATATTNASGVAAVSYRAQQRGNYSATARATSNGATATSSSAAFSAN